MIHKNYSNFSVYQYNFLEHSHPICLYIVYGCLHFTKAELNSYNRDCMAYKGQNIYYWLFA